MRTLPADLRQRAIDKLTLVEWIYLIWFVFGCYNLWAMIYAVEKAQGLGDVPKLVSDYFESRPAVIYCVFAIVAFAGGPILTIYHEWPS